MALNAVNGLFVIFALIALFSGLMVITARNPVKAVLSLIVCFIATAGTWMLLQAEFLSLVLVVVYVGAVMVLFLFVVMMLDVEKVEKKSGFVHYWPFAAVLGIALYCLLINFLARITLPNLAPNWDLSQSNVLQVGMNLFTADLYPFEIAAVILLTAMIAAIALTFRGRSPSTKSQRISAQVRVKAKDRLRMIDMPSATPPAPIPSAATENEEKPA